MKNEEHQDVTRIPGTSALSASERVAHDKHPHNILLIT